MGIFSFFNKSGKQPTGKKSYNGNNYALMLNVDGVLVPFDGNVNGIIRHYESVAPLNTAIDMISSAVASLPIILVDKKTNKTIEKDTTGIMALLQKPNNEVQKTQHDLFRDWCIWRMVDGNAYLNYVAGSAGSKSLYVMQPQHMTIVADDTGFPSQYGYTAANQVFYWYKNIASNRFLTQDGTGDLLQIRNFNPRFSNGNLKGISDVVPLYDEVIQYLQASRHNIGLLTNGARPSGALLVKNTDSTQQGLSDDAFKRLKDEFTESYAGALNSGKPMLLEGGLEWAEMSISPKDMDFLNMKKEAEQQIYKNMGIPIQLITDAGSTYNNKSEAKMQFYKETVIPFGKDNMNSLNSWLMPLFDKTGNSELRIDVKNIDALMTERDAVNKTINDDPTLTINEKRGYKGLQPIEGGDKIVTTTGVAIAGADAVVEIPAPMVDVTGQKKTLNTSQTIKLISQTQI